MEKRKDIDKNNLSYFVVVLGAVEMGKTAKNPPVFTKKRTSPRRKTLSRKRGIWVNAEKAFTALGKSGSEK